MMRRFVTGMAAAAVCRTHALPGVGGLCPPSITVATFRALKSSGRGVGRSTAPGPKRAAQDMEALFDQYMAIVSARGASPMVNAEAAKSFITEHFEANEERTYFLGALQISDSPISAKAWSEAFAKLTPRRVVEDGTFLAAPSSQFRVTHNTSVTMLGLRDDLLAQRHVTTMDWDRRGATAILNSIRSCHPLCPVGIIRGASGTGKTLDAVLTAVCDESVAAACARFTPSHFRSAIDEIEAIGDSDNAARNEKVRTCVMQLVEQVVPEGYREPPATTKARFVLFFDEVGAYPQFVRGLCAVSSRLAADIRTAFVGTVTELLILAGGTGVEGTDHAAGSEPSSYVILERKTDVWETITKTWKEAKADLKKRIDDRVSHAASLARDVVMNPRAAALFCEVVDNESDLLVTDGFMKRATQDACVKFKRRNGLRDLSWSEYLQIMCEAFAAQHTLELSPQAFDRLAREYGVLTDNAQRSASPQKGSILVPGTEETALATIPLQRAPSPTVVNRLLLKAIEVARQSKSILLQRKMEPVTTHLYVPPNEPRYMLDAAQAAMVLVAFDLGDRPPTGGGFEEAGMDYTALSVKIAYASLDGSWWAPSFRVHVGVDSELPPNWRRPIAVVDFLRDVLKGTEPPASIIIKTLEHKVSLGAPAASVMKTFGLDRMSPSDLMSPGRFWLNQANAAGPDGFCFVGKRVLLLQFKYHPRTCLSEWNVFEELYKLGMRTDECVVAAWIQNFSKGKTQLPTSYVIAQSKFEQNLLDEKYAEAFGEICDSQYGELKSFASALRAETSVAERAPFIEVFERQGLKPTFVVMHYGLPPQGVRQKFDGLDVLLVTAAHPQSTNALGMLDDYFPIKISEPHRRHITLPLEVVPKPR